MNIYEKLSAIQAELKAPKSQYNSFGKYHYRSCEDILEAVKPLLVKYKATLILQDEVMETQTRCYIKAIAKLYDLEDASALIESSALAREDEDKKGMDGSQLSGATSSYARKYCLNGLFLIDDTKDADTDENAKERANRSAPKRNTGTVKPLSAVSDGLEQTKEEYHCCVCGKAVDEKIAKPVLAKTGKIYCSRECMTGGQKHE